MQRVYLRSTRVYQFLDSSLEVSRPDLNDLVVGVLAAKGHRESQLVNVE